MTINQEKTAEEKQDHHRKVHRRFVAAGVIAIILIIIGAVYQIQVLIGFRQNGSGQGLSSFLNFNLGSGNSAGSGRSGSGGGGLGTAGCQNCLSISDDNKNLTFSVGARFSVYLPEANYSANALSITANPSDTLGEVFGAEPPTSSDWVRTFQAVKAGTASVTAPANSSSTPDFHITITVH
jgi:hypothetical protein